MGEGAIEIAVNDPLGFFQFHLQSFVKGFPGYMLPFTMPVEPIQMDKGKRCLLRQLFGKGTFS